MILWPFPCASQNWQCCLSINSSPFQQNSQRVSCLFIKAFQMRAAYHCLPWLRDVSFFFLNKYCELAGTVELGSSSVMVRLVCSRCYLGLGSLSQFQQSYPDYQLEDNLFSEGGEWCYRCIHGQDILVTWKFQQNRIIEGGMFILFGSFVIRLCCYSYIFIFLFCCYLI